MLYIQLHIQSYVANYVLHKFRIKHIATLIMHYAYMHGLSIHAYMLYSPVYLTHKRVNLEKI